MKVKWRHVMGSIILLINAWWLWTHVDLFYLYQKPGLDFLIQFSNWVLLLQVIYSLIGCYIGINCFAKRLSIKKSLVIEFGFLVLIILTDLFYWEIVAFFTS